MSVATTGEQLQKAKAFSVKWGVIRDEKQYAQSFWTDFFHQIIGVPDLLLAGIEFEFPVKNVATNTTQFIDVLWGGVALIEHKTAGISLDLAEKQGRNYLVSLQPKLRPRFLVLSNFTTFRVIDVLQDTTVEFPLTELTKNLDRINAVFGEYSKRATLNEIIVDKKAVKLMASLYTEFENAGYTGHHLSVFLVRMLFLLFGDDTGMWNKHRAFESLVEDSPEDAHSLGMTLQELFYTLDTESRPSTTPPEFSVFPYVNGGLFAEHLPVFYFTKKMREALLTACRYDWSQISPAIFGAMFQTVKSKEDRQQLGEHYTSEANILKVIRPLFLDDYLDRMRKAWNNPKQLSALRDELGTRNYLDPACGSGNFLIVAYQRLRDIEKKIIARLQELTYGQGQVGLAELNEYGVRVKLSQFHGIEYEEWSSQIATVAMFLADRQANVALSEIIGEPINRFPLKEAATIACGNALEIDWTAVCPINDNTVIMGNPPFVYATDLSPEQKTDQARIWGKKTGSGSVDYVTSWFLVAGRHIHHTKAVAAFLATNSVSQGQQPAVLWSELFPLGIGIDFAHRSFAWWNEGGKVAGVHTVIIGFSANTKPATLPLWDYATAKGDPTLIKVPHINPYLLNAPDALIRPRTNPLQAHTQRMVYGSKPTDAGHLSNISPATAQRIRDTDPVAAKYLKRIVGSEELIQGLERWCLWLVEADPTDIATSPVLKQRVAAVREMRAKSTKLKTQQDANRPSEFQEIRLPAAQYIAVPLVSSENRDYTPIARLDPEDTITNNLISIIPDGSLLTFGWLNSRVFNVWNKGISGRLESRPRISNTITYNNFPFPETDKRQQEEISKASQAILDARDQHPNSTLAHLYNRDAMPTALRDAHRKLDAETSKVLGLRANATDDRILEVLFTEYNQITTGLLAQFNQPKKRVRAKSITQVPEVAPQT